ncbi:hypothetical protein BZG36_01527 [Bifiguratus adelaidae]|uniref:Gti1/Pac2 family protein n=1 Tax=Bifiguratus adelaidae TaxID=1938954 RepID=A0A261Y4Y0_9FUNG|nr:hypothetical protein BZG36_01527 [Bifiguratus adelaidae]
METFHGYVETTRDTLLLFEACHRAILPRVKRRLKDKERHIVRSGTVFVFDEKESGIKRWTDGLMWSPSRILGNFLIYRELDEKVHTPIGRQRSMSAGSTERALVGSLVNSYKFKPGGLIKKTMSVVVAGVAQHLISYYAKEDVLSGVLWTPGSVPELASLEISPVYLSQNFRIPPQMEGKEAEEESPASSVQSSPLVHQAMDYRSLKSTLRSQTPKTRRSDGDIQIPIQNAPVPASNDPASARYRHASQPNLYGPLDRPQQPSGRPQVRPHRAATMPNPHYPTTLPYSASMSLLPYVPAPTPVYRSIPCAKPRLDPSMMMSPPPFLPPPPPPPPPASLRTPFEWPPPNPSMDMAVHPLSHPNSNLDYSLSMSAFPTTPAYTPIQSVPIPFPFVPPMYSEHIDEGEGMGIHMYPPSTQP